MAASPLHWDPRARHGALGKLLGAVRAQGEAHPPARPDLKQGLRAV